MSAVDVLIVGAGFGGLAAGMALRSKHPSTSVRIIERASDIGGTWRDNVYPGIACDVPAPLYSFADMPNDRWTRLFAPGDEILAYAKESARETGLAPAIDVDTPLRCARWSGGAWRVEVGGSDRPIIAQSLVLACGRLTQPRLPDVTGLSTFPGPVVHTARWDRDLDVDGCRVAVIGTGASAVQVVPALVAAGASVTLFQRTPAWIVPRGDRDYTAAERAGWRADAAVMRELREALRADGEARYASRSGDRVAADAARRQALDHLRRQVPDRRLRRVLTPRYPFGCKRVLLSDDFYPALASGAVRLEATALAGIDGAELVAASGRRHAADIIVFATGFETTRQPYADLVEGEHGKTLAEHWSGGMTSVGSTMVTGFPDLYVMNGPNAALGHNSSILMLEAQADYIAQRIADRTAPVRVTADAEARYTAEIIARSAGTPWVAPGCTNWYVDERSGRLTLLWPGTVDAYRDRLGRIDPTDFYPPAGVSAGPIRQGA